MLNNNSTCVIAYGIFCFVILLTVSSCSSERATTYPLSNYLIPVDPEVAGDAFLDDLVQHTDSIKLNMEGEFLREVHTIKYRDSLLYVLDSGSGGENMAINVFDLKGRHKFKIQQIGRGPGEYEYIYSLWVTEGFLYLASRRNLLVYDNKNGEFVKSIEHSSDYFPMDWIAVLGDSLLIDYDERQRPNTEKKYLKLIDLESGEIVDQKVSFHSHALKSGHSNRYLYRVNDALFFIPSYEKTVLRLDARGDSISIKPEYTFDIKDGYWIPDEVLNNSYSDRGSFFEESPKYIHTIVPYETSDVIVAEYKWNGDNYGVIHFKNRGQTFDTQLYTNEDEACQVYTVIEDRFAFYCDDGHTQTMLVRTFSPSL